MTRILTALVLIPAFVWLSLFAPGWAFQIAMAAVGLIAFWEFDHIAEANGIARGLPFAVFAGATLYDAAAPLQALIVAPDSTIRSAKDFEGQAIAVARWVKVRPNEFVMPARTVFNLSEAGSPTGSSGMRLTPIS